VSALARRGRRRGRRVGAGWACEGMRQGQGALSRAARAPRAQPHLATDGDDDRERVPEAAALAGRLGGGARLRIVAHERAHGLQLVDQEHELLEVLVAAAAGEASGLVAIGRVHGGGRGGRRAERRVRVRGGWKRRAPQARRGVTGARARRRAPTTARAGGRVGARAHQVHCRLPLRRMGACYTVIPNGSCERGFDPGPFPRSASCACCSVREATTRRLPRVCLGAAARSLSRPHQARLSRSLRPLRRAHPPLSRSCSPQRVR